MTVMLGLGGYLISGGLAAIQREINNIKGRRVFRYLPSDPIPHPSETTTQYHQRIQRVRNSQTEGATMKPKIKTITVERKANIRHYTYTAHLSAKTGKLLKIVAGCRKWKTFEEAEAHYRGSTPAGEKWSDGYTPMSDVVRWACRQEARMLLNRLRGDVARAQRRLRARLRNAKKRKVRR